MIFIFFSVISDLCGQLFVLTDHENDNFKKNVIFINKNGFQTTYDYSPFDNIILIEPTKKIDKTYLPQIRINGSIFFRQISDNLLINFLITKKSDTFIQKISLYEEEYILDKKKKIREKISNLRSSFDNETLNTFSLNAQLNLLEFLKKKKFQNIGFFISFNSEVSTHFLLSKSKKKLFLKYLVKS